MDTAIHKGRKFWSGIFDSHDGYIREVHPYKRAQAADFHHSFYVSPQSQDAMNHGDAGFFWVDPGGKVNTAWRDAEAPKHIVDAISSQIEPITKADGGEVSNHPEVPDVVYHGTNKDVSGGFHIPAFFAANPQHADYYANWRGEEGARVYPTKLSMKNPLDVRGREGAMKFIDLARRAGAKIDVQNFPNGSWDFDTDEISKHSNYDGTNLNDLVYSPRVRKQMHKEGYDGLMAHDQLGNEEIPIFVALHQHQAKPAIGKEGGGPVEQDGITAYHGSPHDFDEFDTSKIGTGEGAQAYGHGLYFAEHEPVAKRYKNDLSPTLKAPDSIDSLHKRIGQMALTFSDNTPEGAIAWLDKYKNGAGHTAPAMTADAVAAVKKHFESGEFSPGGHMYEVHINAHPHHMLDWDKPLNEQSEHVQRTLAKSGHNLHQAAQDMFDGKPSDLRGADLYQWLTGKHEGGLGSPENVTKHLSGHGIKGIKYRDAGSRGNKAEPTYNYVVFDHNDVHIKRKYEQGGAVDDIPDIKNPISVFPKPQRMFPEENRPAGGQYLNAKTKEDMTGHKAAQASIGIAPGGRPTFNVSPDTVEQTGSRGKGTRMSKTNLFKQKAGWKWLEAPEGHEDTNTVISVHHGDDHHYALNAHYPKGVDLAKYPDRNEEPRLRPTTKGKITFGNQVGTISVRGKEHPVYNHVIVKADGGPIVKRALELLSKDRTGR
jgi:hypothetical protein